MPKVKHQQDGYLYVPYYKLVFKNDLVKLNEKQVVIIKKFYFYKTGNSTATSIRFFEMEGQNDAAYDCHLLYRRPFLNWLKYFWVLITKRYIL